MSDLVFNRIMNRFEQRKIVEVVLYILNKIGGTDIYHLFKIIYFAEMKHLAKWGTRIIKDDLCAIKFGPVPTELYYAIKNEGNAELTSLIHSSTEFAGDDAPNVLLPKEAANIDYLSKSDMEALDESIKENASLTFNELKMKSHDKAWKEAYDNRKISNVISPMTMASVTNADAATLEYIKEQMDLEKMLL